MTVKPRRNPASVSYAYQDSRDRTIHCEVAFHYHEPDLEVGYQGGVSFHGVFVTEVVLFDGNRVKTSDNAWWEALDQHAATHCEIADDWRELAIDQWNSE